MHPNATDPLRVSNGNDPVHVGAAIAEAVPATSRRRAPTGHGAMPEQVDLPERTRGTGWKNPAYDAEANDPVLVAVDDDHIEHTAALVEKGARSEVDRVLLLCGNKLRDGVPLDLIAEALEETAAETRMLAAACARVRAANAGVEL